MSQTLEPSWPVSAFPPLHPIPLSRGCHPNALLPLFHPLCALRLVPMVLWGPHLPLPLLPSPHAPAALTVGPLARSMSPGTPPPSGHSPMPFPLPTPPSSIRLRSTPGLRHRSRPALTAPGTLWMPLISAFTFAAFTSRHSPPPLAPFPLMPNRRLPSDQVPFVPLHSLALRLHCTTCPSLFYASHLSPC